MSVRYRQRLSMNGLPHSPLLPVHYLATYTCTALRGVQWSQPKREPFLFQPKDRNVTIQKFEAFEKNRKFWSTHFKRTETTRPKTIMFATYTYLATRAPHGCVYGCDHGRGCVHGCGHGHGRGEMRAPVGRSRPVAPRGSTTGQHHGAAPRANPQASHAHGCEHGPTHEAPPAAALATCRGRALPHTAAPQLPCACIHARNKR